MRFNCAKPRESAFERRRKWHRWWAWYPARVGDNDCRWLEVVERQEVHGRDISWWVYRPPGEA